MKQDDTVSRTAKGFMFVIYVSFSVARDDYSAQCVRKSYG
jgi:hypothetical protein